MKDIKDFTLRQILIGARQTSKTGSDKIHNKLSDIYKCLDGWRHDDAAVVLAGALVFLLEENSDGN